MIFIYFKKNSQIFSSSERLTSTQCLRHDWIRKPLCPSTRPRRRRRSTTVSSSEASSSSSSSSEDEEPRQNNDEDEDVFSPVMTDVDEGKKRKISEDVLEKNKPGAEKKRRDDVDSKKTESFPKSDEKMSSGSLEVDEKTNSAAKLSPSEAVVEKMSIGTISIEKESLSIEKESLSTEKESLSTEKESLSSEKDASSTNSSKKVDAKMRIGSLKEFDTDPKNGENLIKGNEKQTENTTVKVQDTLDRRRHSISQKSNEEKAEKDYSWHQKPIEKEAISAETSIGKDDIVSNGTESAKPVHSLEASSLLPSNSSAINQNFVFKPIEMQEIPPTKLQEEPSKMSESVSSKTPQTETKMKITEAKTQETETERQEAETKRQETETKRQEAETKRQEAETKRQEIETKRQEAETKRQEAETKRQETETKRPETETKRQETETKRQETETRRQEAETKRREIETKRQETETKRQEPETRKQEIETKRQEAETKKQETETKRQEIETRRQETETKKQETAVMQEPLNKLQEKSMGSIFPESTTREPNCAKNGDRTVGHSIHNVPIEIEVKQTPKHVEHEFKAEAQRSKMQETVSSTIKEQINSRFDYAMKPTGKISPGAAKTDSISQSTSGVNESKFNIPQSSNVPEKKPAEKVKNVSFFQKLVDPIFSKREPREQFQKQSNLKPTETAIPGQQKRRVSPTPQKEIQNEAQKEPVLRKREPIKKDEKSVQNKQAEEIRTRRREVKSVPISKEEEAMKKHETAQANVRRRPVSVHEKPESRENRGRIVPITLEEEEEENTPKPRVRKHEDQTASSTITSVRQRQRDIPISIEKREEDKVENRNKTAHNKDIEIHHHTSDAANTQKKKEEENKANAKRDLSSDEMELERTKKQLKEFVERWNSQSESSHSPPSSQQTPTLERDKITSPPRKSIHEEDASDVEMQDITSKDEFAHYVIDHPKVVAIHKPDVIARQLQEKLKAIAQSEEGFPSENRDGFDIPSPQTRIRDTEESQKKSNQKEVPRVRRRPSAASDHDHERRNRTDSSSSSSSTHKMPPGRDVPFTAMSPTEIAKQVEGITINEHNESQTQVRTRAGVRQRLNRDVPSKPNRDGVVSIPIAYDINKRDQTETKGPSPTRRSRKTSKDDKPSRVSSRAHSRESNQSGSGRGHRRPSRDVPMTSAQTERLGTLNISGCEVAAGDDYLWPDIRVVAQSNNDDNNDDDEDDDSEAISIQEPLTFKLELSAFKSDAAKSVALTDISTSISVPNAADDKTNTSMTSQNLEMDQSKPRSSISPVTAQYTLPSAEADNNSMKQTIPSNTNIPNPTLSIKDTNTTNSFVAESSSKNFSSKNDVSPKSSSPSHTPDLKDTYVSENKLVAWIMEIGNQKKRIPMSGSTSDLVSHFEGQEPNRSGEKAQRIRERSPKPMDQNREKSPLPPRPPFGWPTSREKSFVNPTSDPNDNVIQTPWGTLKRSTSRNSVPKTSPKSSVETSPSSTTLLRTSCSDVPHIKLDEDRKFSTETNRYSIPSFNPIPSSGSRSPSPRAFKPYTGKSQTTRNLPLSSLPRSDETDSMRFAKSTSSHSKNSQSSPSPPLDRPPSPTFSQHSKANKDESWRFNKANHEDQFHMSAFDKKVSKQTSLEVLDHIEKRDADSTKILQNGKSFEPKYNSLPRSKPSNKEPSSSCPSSRPPSGDIKRNSMEGLDERRRSRTLSGAPLPPKKQFSFLLFSAHDRISQFETKEAPKSSRVQRPISRAKTTTHFKDPDESNNPERITPSASTCREPQEDRKKPTSSHPSVVSTRA
ncbi:hypothetical protein FHG87_021411 [Trinorchestia longiramus]|nr:hypothetical protein FHG87_021411 [Trinorchestia longiramus]